MNDEQNDIFTQMAQLFIDTYEELTEAMEVMKAVGIDPDNRKERVNNLQMRYTGIIEKYQSKIFEQPEQELADTVNNANAKASEQDKQELAAMLQKFFSRVQELPMGDQMQALADFRDLVYKKKGNNDDVG